MLALPAQLGGLGLLNPLASAPEQQAASQQISTPLVNRIINQDHRLDDCHAVQQSIKIRIQHNKHQKQKEDAENLQHILPPTLQRSMELSREKGASTWITTLPIDEHGLLYTKLLSETAFRSDMVG